MLENMSSLQKLALVSIQFIVMELEEEGTKIQIKAEGKVYVEVKVEGKNLAKEIVQEDATFKA